MLVALLMASTLATLGAGASSLAYFTDTTQSTAGSWTTGTIVLGVTPTTAWTASNILPGDTGSQTIKVANTGTGQLRYAVTTAISGETKSVASQLSLSIKAGTCPGAGAALYSGALAAAVIGNPAQGGDTGDRVIDASTSENLCFAWTFSSAAGNTYQGAAATATFSFAAEQTANLP